jgi:hypothetical protein
MDGRAVVCRTLLAPASAAPGGGVFRAVCALLVAGVLVVLPVGVPPGPLAAAQAPSATALETGTSETAAAAFLPAFRQAWAGGGVAEVLPLFAAEAVVQLDYREPGGPLEYRRGGAGPMALRAGVALLLGPGAQPDPATLQVAPVVFGGAPATAVRWAYRRPSHLPGVPPEVGTDDLVLQGGRLVAYTRAPDGANEAARLLALSRTMGPRGAPDARAAHRAGPGGARGLPSAQEQGTPAVGPWILTAGLSVLAVVVLAALKRPNGGWESHAPGECL